MNLLEKLSSYNLVTNLIPGAVLTESFRAIGLPVADSAALGAWLVLSYALGVISNRFGSLIVEPIVRRVSTFPLSSYSDFVRASKEDEKIEVLIETANGYRSALGAVLVFIFGMIANYLVPINSNNLVGYSIVMVAVVSLVFGFSYIKQYRYVEQRIRRVCDGSS